MCTMKLLLKLQMASVARRNLSKSSPNCRTGLAGYPSRQKPEKARGSVRCEETNMSSVLVSTGVLPRALEPHVIRELESCGVTVFKDRTDPYIKILGAN